ncbi:alpha/beta fold hydrolase [Ornithinimicrobium cryptoxanthini]|uniref:Alpha/beta hydrolase n=1 Tax=Ornithinimicrobium cryptoxanthini TaxID=2934161 RepID=A0ABY4YJ86_9MICO|nr:alpha/beta hydrolase [Ornithinimicrobium cryptoxanthini]USQ76310.1 alpha/beta hydrolase [Ornithinimicrobium cryptoxanthini]
MSPLLRSASGPISYSLSGPQDAGTRDLVLVHGWCCDRTALAPLRERFEQAHRVLSLDLRGHGQSRETYDDGSAGVGSRRGDQDEPATGTVATRIEEFADDVLAVSREAGLHSPVVIGHSLGALVALATLDRADAAGAAVPVGAVLLDPAPLAHGRGKAFWADQVEPVSRDHSGELRRGFARSLVLPTDTADYTQVVEVMASVHPRVAAGGAQAMAQFDGAAVLGRLSAPILVIQAATAERDLDRLVPDRALLTLGRTVGAGHFHQFEVPDQLEPMIERWLSVTDLSR